MDTKEQFFLFEWSNGCGTAVHANSYINAVLRMLDCGGSIAARYRTQGHQFKLVADEGRIAQWEVYFPNWKTGKSGVVFRTDDSQ